MNLKILLGLAISRGDLTLEERNALLSEVEADVVRHVLYDNFLQAQILSQKAATSAQRMEVYEDLMTSLEAEWTSTATSRPCRTARRWPSVGARAGA